MFQSSERSLGVESTVYAYPLGLAFRTKNLSQGCFSLPAVFPLGLTLLFSLCAYLFYSLEPPERHVTRRWNFLSWWPSAFAVLRMWWAGTLALSFHSGWCVWSVKQMTVKLRRPAWTVSIKTSLLAFLWVTARVYIVVGVRAKPFEEIPGPLGFPIIGSQWLYYWPGPYTLDKLHLANEGLSNLIYSIKLSDSYFLCQISFGDMDPLWKNITFGTYQSFIFMTRETLKKSWSIQASLHWDLDLRHNVFTESPGLTGTALLGWWMRKHVFQFLYQRDWLKVCSLLT